jgi:hypothetical protein
MHLRVRVIIVLFVTAFGTLMLLYKVSPSETFEIIVEPNTFKNDRVFYVAPCTGGDIHYCQLTNKSSFEQGQAITISKSGITGKCTVSKLDRSPLLIACD